MTTQIKEQTVSTNEKQFILESLKDSIRTDGRGLTSSRRTLVTFEEEWGVSRVTLGNTQVITTISSEIVEPINERGNEGYLVFNVQFPPIASPYFQSQHKSLHSVEISRIIERCIKDTNCVDIETLCIIAKERVWSISVDIRVINYDGNLIDACTLSALAALMWYRRPDVTVTEQGVTVHNELEKNFVPLHLQCYPLTTTFALFNSTNNKLLNDTGNSNSNSNHNDNNSTLYNSQISIGEPISLVDPSLLEDLTCDGVMTIATTPNLEILCINATGTDGYETSLVLQNSNLAIERGQTLYSHLKTQLDEALKKKKHKIF